MLVTVLKEESVARILEASGTSVRGVQRAQRVEDEWDGLVFGTAAAVAVQCKD